MKHSPSLFWIRFLFLSTLFLIVWFFYWETKNHSLESARRLFGALPITEETKTDIDTVISLADSVLFTHGKEKTFLILFQNNLELRPGGGFIGSFGILKVKDGFVTDFAVHDTGNFDGRIPNTILPPYPMKETLHIDSWKLRDSNYSPDFPSNAKQAEIFYQMGNGQEKFDGIIAITTNVLSSFLRVTGPVTLDGFPGTYGADNAILDLEYQVEQGYAKQNIDFGERKSMMSLLGFEILHRVKDLSLTKKYELFNVVLDDLHRKDIQLFFKDDVLQDDAIASGFDGSVDKVWKNDYLFVVDANLNSFKSDYYMKRAYEYTIDLSSSVPKAILKITYTNTAETKDWFAKDYQTFLRVYVPTGSYLHTVTGSAQDAVFGEELNKKYFGALIHIPISTEKTVVFEYTLPESFKSEWYDLKIQKQAGLNDVPVSVTILMKDGQKKERHIILNRDMVLGDIE